MGIETVPHAPYSPYLAFLWLYSLSSEAVVEEMKEAVTKVIVTLTQEDFHGASQKLFERYNKCITAWGVYYEED